MTDADEFSNPQIIATSVLLASLGSAAIAARYRSLRGTTLIGSQCWFVACLIAVAAVEVWFVMVADVPAVRIAAPLRYVAATLTFCPLIALLGAKRPQDRAWHFIVLSLWVVLALPALHVMVLRPGQSLTMPPALAYFMMGMVVIGSLNRLMTRDWLSGFLFASGQVSLLPPHFPLLGLGSEAGQQTRALIGLGLIAGAAISSWWVGRGRRSSHEPRDRLWLDFRDLFGVFWALRLAERVNSAAIATKSELVLRWTGFQTPAGGRISERLSANALRTQRQGLENLLRRFVSRAWIAERLPESENLTGAEHEKP